tara:strand:- start:163 stop:363 length:201 start_codon:yes stop_codon:yes gene_type:complete
MATKKLLDDLASITDRLLEEHWTSTFMSSTADLNLALDYIALMESILQDRLKDIQEAESTRLDIKL